MARLAWFEHATYCLAYHYSFRYLFRVCGLDYTFTIVFTVGGHRLVSTRSLFLRLRSGLLREFIPEGSPNLMSFT